MQIDPVKYMQTKVRSKQPGIVIVSSEDERVIGNLISSVAKPLRMQAKIWTKQSGFYDALALDDKTGEYEIVEPEDRQYAKEPVIDPQEALSTAATTDGRCMFIFRRFHFHMSEQTQGYAELVGLLQDICEMFKSQPAEEAKCLVFVMPRKVLPEEVKDLFAVMNWPLPTLEELKLSVKDIAGSFKPPLRLTDERIDSIASAARGLTYNAAENCFAGCYIEAGDLDPLVIANQKKDFIQASGVANYIEPEGGLEQVAGLEEFKKWALRRRRLFTAEARKYGLKPPKGVVITGVTGCGKSLVVKCLGIAWGMVVVSLDMGKLFSKWQGDSEGNMRELIALVESISPCILLVDEFEAAFAGMKGSGATDGGTGNRMGQTFLTWMQEKTAPVFVAATCNDPTLLPIEMLRSGRFDAIFAVDLPHLGERAGVFEIHLSKRGRKPEDFDMAKLVAASDGYTGSDIEQAILDAMTNAFDADEEVSTKHVFEALKERIPMSQTAPEKIKAQQAWAKEMARPASLPFTSPTTKKAAGGGRFGSLEA